MKIVHFINSLGSGGAEKVVVNITTNLSSKYNFEIITKNNDNIYESELKKKNISVIESPELRGNIIKHCIFLYKYFKMNFKEISLVHIHAGTINYFLPLIFAAIFKVPVIVHSHGSKSSSFYGAIIHKILRIIVFNLFRTYNIACSKEAGKWMFYNKHYNIIYNGIDLRKYKHIPEKKQTNKIIIGHVGKFLAVKNHSFLVRFFNFLVENNYNAELHFYGEGPMEKEVKVMAISYNIYDKVFFHGLKKNINEIYNEFDCFIFPSFHEGLPLVLIEAQAVGIPCLISNKIDTSIIVNENVMNFDLKENFIEVEKKLICLINFGRIQSNLEKSKFDINIMLDSIECLYKEIIG